MTITVTIDDEKLAEYREAFLRVRPIPVDNTGKPLFTEAQWFKQVIKDFIISTFRQGKILIEREKISVPDSTVEVS
ncbi:MAG: hypothetical protein ACTSPB_15405 [Candidatus Thorarchaeota archaeon]